jgi:hypothetical protein
VDIGAMKPGIVDTPVRDAHQRLTEEPHHDRARAECRRGIESHWFQEKRLAGSVESGRSKQSSEV